LVLAPACALVSGISAPETPIGGKERNRLTESSMPADDQRDID
jgi:hypothetical protein